MTQPREWKWETVWGQRVPVISVRDYAEWTRLRKTKFLSFDEAVSFEDLQSRVRFRRRKLKEAHFLPMKIELMK